MGLRLPDRGENTPPTRPSRTPARPANPSTHETPALSERRAPAGGEAFILKPQPTPPRNGLGGWASETRRSEAPPTPPRTPSRSSIRNRLRAGLTKGRFSWNDRPIRSSDEAAADD